MFPADNVDVDKPASPSHQWVRIKLGNVCTHVDSFWASGGDDATGTWIKEAELDTSNIYMNSAQMKANDNGPCEGPCPHAMEPRWNDCAWSDGDEKMK